MTRYLWALAVLPFLAAIVTTGGCGATGPTDTAQDSPTVILHGYTFSGSSNVLTHPWFTVSAKTPKVTAKGWGSQKGHQITVTFSDGGLTAGVRTLRQTATISGHVSSAWYAQDTQGNIHYLAVLDHGKKAVRGVAMGAEPWLFLLKASQLKKGATWTNHQTDWEQDVVMSTSATFRGKSGLLYIRDIVDMNGNHRFDPSWTGHDQRHDEYLRRGGNFGIVQVNATGGYGP